mgnify:CR=1 FL=1
MGLDLYLKLLGDAVREMQAGGESGVPERTVLNLRIDLRLKSSYISEARDRILIYKRAADAARDEDIRAIEMDLRDRFGKFGDEVRALLLVTEIRVRAEQKGIISVETDSSRLKCLRHSGRRDDWVQVGTRFPRLTAPKPLLRLREILVFLNNLPSP